MTLMKGVVKGEKQGSSSSSLLLSLLPSFCLQTALAAVKRATDSLLFQAEEATLYLEEDPQALLHSLVTTPTRPHPPEDVWREDSDIVRIQQEMEHTQKMLAQILLQ